MPKKALGRGLGQLLSKGQAAAAQPSLAEKHPKDPADLGPGLRALVFQKNGGSAQRNPALPPARSKGDLAMKLSLLAADVFLLFLTWLWWKTCGRPLTVGQIVIVVTGATIGAGLGCLASWLHFGR